MGVYRTLETRWFFAGPCTAAAIEWFGAGYGPRGEPERVDTYITLPGRRGMGVKFRGDTPSNRLEVKALAAGRGVVRFAPAASGIVEEWTKWSATDIPPRFQLLHGEQVGPRAISVAKKRWQRKFRLDAKCRAIPFDEPAGMAAVAELAELTVDGRPHWTLAAEAFPGPAIPLECFRECLENGILAGLPFPLNIAQSMSYPIWIDRIIHTTSNRGVPAAI